MSNMQEIPVVEIRLHEMMGKRKIRTIEELHSRSGLSRKAISTALKNENHRMKVDTLAKLCKALECDVSELLVIKK